MTQLFTEEHLDVVDFRPAKSVLIKEVEYQKIPKTMFIRFTTGQRYKYEHVPEWIFKEMQEAVSVGEYFNNNVKNRFDFTLLP